MGLFKSPLPLAAKFKVLTAMTTSFELEVFVSLKITLRRTGGGGGVLSPQVFYGFEKTIY